MQPGFCCAFSNKTIQPETRNCSFPELNGLQGTEAVTPGTCTKRLCAIRFSGFSRGISEGNAETRTQSYPTISSYILYLI